MPIYARNSLGSDVKITANENYSYADMGRILSECVQNDQTLFNAVLLSDFKENTAIREGTMVSSELAAFREEAKTGAWESLKKKLRKVWEKIKGVFRNVYAKMSVWFVRNGKAFVATNRKILATKNVSGCKIPLYLKPEKSIPTLHKKVCDKATSMVEKMGTSASDSANVDDVLGAIEGATSENFSTKFKEAAFSEVKDSTFGSMGEKLESLFAVIEGKRDSIKELKDAEKNADAAIKKAMNAIKAAQSKAEKGEDTTAFKTASANCSTFERAVTIATKAAIKCVRDRVSNCRQIVGALLAYNPKAPTAENAIYQEMAWLEGADDFAEVDDIPAEEINADDVQSDPDVEINVTVDDDGNECSK